jgi:hypothetical protein
MISAPPSKNECEWKRSRWDKGGLTERYVRGRKTRVRIAMVFIAALSLRAASPTWTMVLLSRWATRLNVC